jgi:hypothetical protein
MPGTATTRGANRPKATPRRTTRAAKGPEVLLAPEKITESVSRVPDAPEISGGAVTLGAKAPEIERETLFYVGGVGYTIPKSFRPNAALGYAHVVRTQGTTAAVDWAMEKALGTVGYAVLREQEDLTDEVLTNMVTLVIARIEGLPDPKPKSS